MPENNLSIRPAISGKGTKIVAIAAGNSLTLAVSVQSASPVECKLVEEVLAGSFLDELPARLIGDKAYDSDPLNAKLADKYNIELVAPNQRGCKRITQDGRKLQYYRTRWRSNDSSSACTISAASSRDGSVTSKTSSASSTLPVYI